jgi:preprotein translocase subunit SecF
MAPTKARWQFPVRHPLFTLTAGLTICAAAATIGIFFSQRGRLLHMMRPHDPEVRRWERFTQAFGHERNALVRYPDIDPARVSHRRTLAQRGRRIEHLLAGRAVSVPLVDNSSPGGLLWVSHDPRQINDETAFAKLRLAVQKTKQAAAKNPTQAPQAVTLDGELVLRREARATTTAWLRYAPWILGLLGLLVLAFGGGPRAFALTTVVTAGGLSSGFALMAPLGADRRLDALLPAVTVCLLAVFFVRRLLDAVESSPKADKSSRVGGALYRAVGPILLTAGVLAMAFVGMGASRFSGVRNPSLIAALGAIATAVTAVTIAPALLVLWPGSWHRHPARASLLAGWTGRVNKVLVAHRRPLLLTLLLLLAGSGVAALHHTIGHPYDLARQRWHALWTREKPTARTISLSLVVTAKNQQALFATETLHVFDRIEQKIRHHPAVEATYGLAALARRYVPAQGQAKQLPLARRLQRLRTSDPRWVNRFVSPHTPKTRILITARLTHTRALRKLKRWIERQSHALLPADFYAQVTGSMPVTSHTLDTLATAYIVGLVRFLGMLFILVIALTKDPRLGLTASVPALLPVVVLAALFRLTGWSMHLGLAGALIVVAMWSGLDALNALLKVARIRFSPPGVSLTASATSLRSAFLLAPFLAVATAITDSAATIQAGLSAGVGLALGSLISSFTVPSLLAFMPGARLHGPLWEHTRRSARKNRRRDR